MSTEKQIKEVISIVRDMDAIMKRLNELMPSRPRNLAITKIEEGALWLGVLGNSLQKVLQEEKSGEPNPKPMGGEGKM